ncbi:MAG: MerR family transcriptional regulator [Bacteroidetes bacterium]|nr:MerR family transcriptional regulator [Bacteroidota bacterium]
MGKYSIKELERLSGIRAHTIRIWEKRHKLISPQRTQTNIRYYSDEDLKKIINVAVLNNNGVKISKIANLSIEEINGQVAQLSETKDSIDIYIEQLIMATIDMEEAIFGDLIGKFSLKFGFERTLLEIIYPFLEKIGVLWLTNNITPAQEHFISNLIRNKLIVAIENLPMPRHDSRKVVLFLPENELHEIGLLFFCFLCKNAGLRTFYLGQTLPYASLKSVYEAHQPDILISAFTTHPHTQNLQGYIDKLSADFLSASIFITGHMLTKKPLTYPKNVTAFANAQEIKELISKIIV